MFGRPAKTAVPAPDPGGHAPSGYVQDIGLTALPDAIAIGRVAALTARIGAGLAGHSGAAYGYDHGDPARSLTGPVQGRPLPTAALAQISRSSDLASMPTPSYSDLALTDPALDPYMAQLWARMVNR
jgi:hypothetical protein